MSGSCRSWWETSANISLSCCEAHHSRSWNLMTQTTWCTARQDIRSNTQIIKKNDARLSISDFNVRQMLPLSIFLNMALELHCWSSAQCDLHRLGSVIGFFYSPSHFTIRQTTAVGQNKRKHGGRTANKGGVREIFMEGKKETVICMRK